MGAHKRLSPSGAETWMICPGSPTAQEGKPEETTQYALEGTFGHEVREICLSQNLNVVDLIDREFEIEGETFIVGEEEVEHIQPGLDYVRDLLDTHVGHMYVEAFLDLHCYHPDCGGTTDTALIFTDVNIIIDFKYGQGVEVSPVRNKQLMQYALAAYEKHKDTITSPDWILIVEQPRVRGSRTEWRTDIIELLRFAAEMVFAAKLTEVLKNVRRPGAEQCRWCKAKGECEAYADYMLGLFGDDFKYLENWRELNRDIPPKLSPEARSKAILNQDLFPAWIKAIEKEAKEDYLAGRNTPGLKLVLGRKGNRKWRDPAVMERMAKVFGWKNVHVVKFKSPSQLEKTIPAYFSKIVDSQITRREGLPVLVPESDPRTALGSSVSKFSNLDDDLL